MIPVGPVVARNKVAAVREAVWAYIVTPELRASWWPEVQLDTHQGGVIAERWSEESDGVVLTRDAVGEIDVWVEGHALGYKWRDSGDRQSTAVLLTLRTQGAATGITITETGFDALPGAAERAAESQQGWDALLSDLVAVVEAATEDGFYAEEILAAHAAVEAAAVASAEDDSVAAATVENAVEAEPEPVVEAEAAEAVTVETADSADEAGAVAEGAGEVEVTDEAEEPEEIHEAEEPEEPSESENAAGENDSDADEEEDALDFDAIIHGTDPLK